MHQPGPGPGTARLLTRFGTFVLPGGLRHGHGPAGPLAEGLRTVPLETPPFLGLEQDGTRLAASGDGALRPAADPAAPEASFLPLDPAFLALAEEIAAEAWTLEEAGQVPAGESGIGPDFLFRLGPRRIRLDTGPEVLAPERRDGRLAALRYVHNGWRVGHARAFRPLIYFLVFRAPEQFELLSVCLSSIAALGRYEGDILVVTDRPEDFVRRFIPASFQARTSFVHRDPADVFEMMRGRYVLDDLPIDHHQPVAYLDTDIVCDAPIAPLLEGLNRQPGFHFCPEYGGQSIRDLPRRTRFFGDFLFDRDPRAPARPLCLNAGAIGFHSKAQAAAPFRQVLAAIEGYARQNPAIARNWGEQPYANYVFQTQGLAVTDLFARHITLAQDVAVNRRTPRLGLVHFNKGVGRGAAKLGQMRAYAAQIGLALPPPVGAEAAAAPGVDAAPAADAAAPARAPATGPAAGVPAPVLYAPPPRFSPFDRPADHAPRIPNAPMLNRSIPGQMTDAELERLMALARRVPPGGVIVEVGCLYGLSSWHIAKACAPGVTLFCVDPWQRENWIVRQVEQPQGAPTFGRDAFARFTADCENIVMIQGFSPQVVRGWQIPVDMYFEDAVHTNPGLALNMGFWSARVKPGGIVCGHDYAPRWADVVSEADALGRAYGSKVEVVDTLWSVEKPALAG